MSFVSCRYVRCSNRPYNISVKLPVVVAGSPVSTVETFRGIVLAYVTVSDRNRSRIFLT